MKLYQSYGFSRINITLKVKIQRTTEVGSYRVIVPEITGRAFITQIS